MLRVRTAQARAGMELAMPVFHPKRHDTLLLRTGVKLEPATIRRLREMNMPELWIRYPSLEVVSDYVNPAVYAQRAVVTRQIADAYDTFSTHVDAELDFGDFRDAMNGMIGMLSEQPRTALFLSEMVEAGQPEVRHASNVAFLSVLMGLRLEFYLMKERSRLRGAYAKNVANLGVAGMMHDIGMLRLDEETIERWEQTGDEEDEAWREHVMIGYNLVRGELEPSAAAAVLHHHQKFDGTGFPLRTTFGGEEVPMVGSDIHVYARVVAAADLFDRLMHPPGASVDDPAASLPVVRVLRMMQQEPYRGWIDPVVLSGLISVAPPYPPGSVVRLSNGVRGVVVSWTQADPCRPEVVEVTETLEANDDDTPGARIDLREHPDLCIAEMDGHDVTDDNFSPDDTGCPPLDSIARAMVMGAQPPGAKSPEAPEQRKAG